MTPTTTNRLAAAFLTASLGAAALTPVLYTDAKEYSAQLDHQHQTNIQTDIYEQQCTHLINKNDVTDNKAVHCATDTENAALKHNEKLKKIELIKPVASVFFAALSLILAGYFYTESKKIVPQPPTHTPK